MLLLILSILLLLLSLLTVFSAPFFHAWYLAIIVTEFPWVFVIATVLLLVWAANAGQYKWPALLTGAAALVLFLLPVIQAMQIGGHLPAQLDGAFGKSAAIKQPPYAPLKMITGIGSEPDWNYNTITYDTANALTFDHYPAELEGDLPCVVVVHGGSWRGGDSRQLPELNAVLAKEGYHVISINYRKVPQHKNPAPLQDLTRALAYIHNNAASLHVDTSRIVLLGRSAGAQIALLGAYTIKDMGIRGVINYYGPADMVWGYNNPSNPWVYNSCQVLDDYMGGSFSQMPGAYTASSPIEFVNAQTVPTLLIHGQTDVLVAYGHSIRLVKKLQQYGVPHHLLTLPWATHGCDYTLNGPSGQLATYAVRRFLEAVFVHSKVVK